MRPHHFYNTNFQEMLAIGKFNEDIISEEFEYQGIPLIRPPEGKQPFDRFLSTPTGTKSIEIKCDFRSQRTGCAAIEWPRYANPKNDSVQLPILHPLISNQIHYIAG